MSKYAARFSKEAYNLVKSGDKHKRWDLIDKNIEDTGFKVDRSKTNRDILYLVNETTGEHHIAVRGTDGNSKGLKNKQDILTDLTFALGAEKHNKHFNKKVNRINKLVKQSDSKDITMSGHSLGGGITNEAIKSKKHVRDKVKHVDTYNAAFSPFTKNASKATEKKLKSKVIHHRNKFDGVSASSLVNNTTGTIKEYDTKDIKKLPKFVPEHLKNAFNTIDQLKAHSVDQFID